jgi:uncharacterized protein (TIGR02246 family)
MQAGDLHQRVQTATNEGDINGLVELYEPDARMLRDDGSVAKGLDAIRDIWAGLVAVGGQISMTTRYVVETGDTALLSNSWTFKVEDMSFSGVTAEVARRQADGSWLYLIDNPYAGRNEDA